MVSAKLEAKGNIHRFPPRDNQLYNAALDAYERGDHRGALERAIALIDGGYGHAYALAGTILEDGGNGVAADPQAALFYYQKAVDEVGAVEAWLALGRLSFFGKGVTKNYEKAFHYYAVVDQDTNHRVAHLMLGRMYMEGIGVKQDLEKARAYLKKAAEEGAVYGWVHLGDLERRSGRVILGTYMKVKAAIEVWWTSLHSTSHYRLRQW